MGRRRRVELSAIASLDEDIARARERCERHIERAYDRLKRFRDAAGSVHDRYLECLREFFDAAADELHIQAYKWPETTLQVFLGRFFVAYRELEACSSLWTALEGEGALWTECEGARAVRIDSFDVLKNALKRDTATRLAEHGFLAHDQSMASRRSLQKQAHGADDELSLPRLMIPGKRPRPGPTASPPRPPAASHSPRSSISAVNVSESESTSWLDDDDQDNDYAVPTNSFVVPTEFSIEVAKKSQNWFGRWLTRHLTLRWNELEMCKKSAAASHRHGVARSFPSQPAMALSMAGTTPPMIAATGSAQGPSASAKIKRYALQNLLSIKLIQLNESEPGRKHAIDLHFKQPAANGQGHTTKSLILGSDKGIETLKMIMTLIATMALFRGIVAGEKAQQLQRFVQAGANTNALYSMPSHRFSAPMTPLQLALVQAGSKVDKQNEIATMAMLLEAKADPRCFLHWYFVRRVLLSGSDKVDPSAMDLLFPPLESQPPATLLPLTAFGSDEFGWTLLMYLCMVGDVQRVQALLDRVEQGNDRDTVLRYLEHINGDGDTALHVAIKATSHRNDKKELGENVALAIVKLCIAQFAASTLLFTSDATSETVVHLAVKAHMWKLTELLLEHKLVEPCARDKNGNNALHLAIKANAPLSIIGGMVRLFKHQGEIDSPDRTTNASPVVLAVLHRREDVMKMLMDAGAETVSLDLSDIRVAHEHGEDTRKTTLLAIAIRMGLPQAARHIWRQTSASSWKSSARWTSTTVSAIRNGMFRLAFEIAQDLASRQQDLSIEDEESGDPIVIVAIEAKQFELAALFIDLRYSEANSQNIYSGETLLHALVNYAIDEDDPKPGHESGRRKRSRLKSKSDGDLHSVAVGTIGLQVPDTVDAAFSQFYSRVVEELYCCGLMSESSLKIISAIVRRSKNHYTRHSNRLRSGSDTGYTLIHALAGGSSALSYQLLSLTLAAARIKYKDADRIATVLEMLCARIGNDGDGPIMSALSRGETDTALLLLHQALPMNPEDFDHAIDHNLSDVLVTGSTTALHLACRHPTEEEALVIVDLLMQADVYAGSWDAKGLSPLHLGIQHKCDERLIQIFRKYDQDLNLLSEPLKSLNISDEDVTVPLTPLMTAIEFNNVVAFRELVRCGAEVRITTPKLRLGLLQFAARQGLGDRQLIHELIALKILLGSASSDSGGMTAAEAAEILQSRLHGDAAAEPTSTDVPSVADSALEEHKNDQSADTKQERVSTNGVLRITLLGLQTPDLEPLPDVSIPSLPPLSPSRDPLSSFQLSPPRTPVRQDSSRSRTLLASPSPERQSRESSRERSQTPPLSRHPHLDDTALTFLKGEEKATLTLIAHEARAEAQEWLKKRSGQKKLLSEARAQLQASQTHRRTPSGTIVIPESAPLVTDEQLLETYKALAAKQFVDKHVADAVAEARVAIEHEKRLIFKDTGVFPGEIPFFGKTKDSSVGSSSVASGKGERKARPASGSMLMLSSRSNEAWDPGYDSDRATPWWSERHGTSFGDDDNLTLVGSGTFIEDRDLANATWLTTSDTDVVNPLERESFIHIIEKRKSLT